MLRSRLLPLVLLLAPFGATADSVNLGAATIPTTNDQAAVAEFSYSVNKYVELHRVLAAPLGAEEMCSDPEEIQRGVDRLANAIRAERPAARPGNVFTPDVASFFRRHIAAVLRDTGYDVEVFLDEMDDDEIDEEGFVEVPPLEVNGAFPWAAGNLMWPSMLSKLPLLPEEVEYRFVGRHLVLLDVRANLVIDILEDALPAASIESEPQGPRNVHPELDVSST